MGGPNDALTLQLLEWISSGRRTYAEVLEAWHSTCPRLSICSWRRKFCLAPAKLQMREALLPLVSR